MEENSLQVLCEDAADVLARSEALADRGRSMAGGGWGGSTAYGVNYQ